MVPVKIAEIPIHISCRDTAFFDARLREYRIENAAPRMTLTSDICDRMVLPPGETVEKIRALTLVRTPDGNFYHYSTGREGQVLCLTGYDPAYTRVDIRQWALRRHPVFSLTDYEYMYTGMAFANRLAYEGGLALHASALAYRGQGIAFSAVSGTGKSTHTGLWREYLGDEAVIINDDKPAIRFADGQPVLYGTPWSGKTDLNQNTSAPLCALVFLRQAPENRLMRLTAADAYYELLGGVTRPPSNAALGVRMLDSMERLLACVPAYQLSCTASREAVRIVYEEIIGGKMP